MRSKLPFQLSPTMVVAPNGETVDGAGFNLVVVC